MEPLRTSRWIPALMALGMASGAASYLLLVAEPPARSRPAPPGPPADDIPTMDRPPGYGVFDRTAFRPSARARALAARASVDELAERLAEADPEERPDLAAALAIEAARRSTDPEQVARALGPLAASDEPGLRRNALVGLLRSGGPGLDALIETLGTLGPQDGSASAQADLLAAIEQIATGSEGGAALVAERLLAGGNPALAEDAARALAGLGGPGTDALGRALEALGSQRAGESVDRIETLLRALGAPRSRGAAGR